MNERRLLIALAVVCLLVAVAAVGYGAGKASDLPEVVRAQRFELVDREGKVLAVLGTSNEGTLGLELRDKEGKTRGGLGMSDDGSLGLELHDKSGLPLAGLVVLAEGTARLELADKEGQTRAILGASSLVTSRAGSDGGRCEPWLVLLDKDGNAIWQAP